MWAVGRRSAQSPWETPEKPTLLTGDPVTLDPWREHRSRRQALRAGQALIGEPTAGTQGLLYEGRKKLYFKRNPHPFGPVSYVLRCWDRALRLTPKRIRGEGASLGTPRGGSWAGMSPGSQVLLSSDRASLCTCPMPDTVF